MNRVTLTVDGINLPVRSVPAIQAYVCRQILPYVSSEQLVDNLDYLLATKLVTAESIIRNRPQHDITPELWAALADYIEDPSSIFLHHNEPDVAAVMDNLLKRFDIDNLVQAMWPWHIAKNLGLLLDKGANAEQLIDKITDSSVILDNFDALVAHGANVNQLLIKIGFRPDWYTQADIASLLKLGAKPEIICRGAFSNAHPESTRRIILALLDNDVSANLIASVIKENLYQLGLTFMNNYDLLVSRGAEICDLNEMIGGFCFENVFDNLDFFESHGVKINLKKYAKYVAKTEFYGKCSHVDILKKYGIN